MLSVIIATFNRDIILCKTLKQLLVQTGVHFEIVVVDQTAKHDLETMQFLKANKNSIYYHILAEPNLPAARNFGIAQSKGELIIFLDDDVLIDVDFVKTVEEIFNKNNQISGLTGLSRSPNMRVSDKWNVVPRRNRDRMRCGLIDLAPTNTLPGFFMAFKKNVLIEVGGFDEWIGTQPKAANEDGELCLRLVLSGYKLFVTSQIEILHLAEKSGGCEVRTSYDTQKHLIKFQQYKMNYYSLNKNKKLMSFFQFYLMKAKLFKGYWLTYNYSLNKLPQVFSNILKMKNDLKYQLNKEQG